MKYRQVIPLSFFVLFAWVAGPFAAEVDAEFKKGEELLDAWRITEAEALAAKALRDNPKSARALDFDGRVKFYQGRYPEAVKSFDQALAIDSKDQRRQAFKLLSQQTQDVIKALKRFESPHFILYLDDKRDGILAPYALETLEKSYEAIGAELGFYPKEKVRVEIAPDASSFNAISTLSLRDIEETGAVGICKFNKLMIISPRVLSFGYRWVDSLSHEYIHYAIVALTNNQAPIWLHEGMARFYETRWRKPVLAKDAAEDYLTPANQTLLVQALKKDQFVGFKNMEPSLIHLETTEQVQLAYAEAASAIDYINHSKGKPGIRDLLAALNDRPTPEAIEKTFGLSFETFQVRWKDFLKSKGLKEIEGSRVRKLRVKKDASDDQEIVELKEIQSVVARNRTHLGDQLLGKGRPVAAVNEYKRALQASPRSPIILNKLGRVLIQMSRYEEALQPLKTAIELDPDNANSYVQLGRIYHAGKNFQDGRSALEESVQINPFNPLTYQLLAEFYTALKEEEKAKRAKSTLQKLTGAN
ncbi:MAG TPA: tetratricopeptide repeat protein [Candidatus Binatia bacterium]|nr:tetratricopeptide repeat protein [Candidatus Binatia bacterium]